MSNALIRTVYRKTFQGVRSHAAFSGAGIKTSLAPEVGKKVPLATKHVEEDHGHHHETPPTPISYSPKIVFTKQRYLTTYLAPSTFTKADFLTRHYSTSAVPDRKKVAVVLSGSGVHDGSEIQEAVSILIHLSRAGVEAKCFAPDIPQADVINLVKGSATDETRNVLVESARISRGKIKPLSQLNHANYSAIVFPGGYGAAKNLCTFAKEAENCSVQPDVARVIKEFHAASKPIGFCCVAPVIAAKVIPGVRVTLGNEDKDIAEAIGRIGAKHEPATVTDIVIDEKNSVVSTPAYMCNAPVHKVYEGIGKLVDSLLSIAKKNEQLQQKKLDEEK